MQTKVQTWGKSLAIPLPLALAQEIGLSPHSIVEVSVVDNQIILRPVKSPFTLEQLVAGITDDNLHDEVDTGIPVGKEKGSW